MKLTDLQKEVSPVWEEKGYEVLKYDREAVKQKTNLGSFWSRKYFPCVPG